MAYNMCHMGLVLFVYLLIEVDWGLRALLRSSTVVLWCHTIFTSPFRSCDVFGEYLKTVIEIRIARLAYFTNMAGRLQPCYTEGKVLVRPVDLLTLSPVDPILSNRKKHPRYTNSIYVFHSVCNLKQNLVKINKKAFCDRFTYDVLSQ